MGKPLKCLNLYAGIGGNRKNWKDVEVTAVEFNPEIAQVYEDHFPDDILLIEDAHEYLLKNYSQFDFIWSSVPCQTHSRARKWAFGGGKTEAVYPDMKLWQEIIFLQHYFKGKWVVENVTPYYDSLIPGRQIGRHMFWSNFYFPSFESNDSDIHSGKEEDWIRTTGFDLRSYSFKNRKDQIYRNTVIPELGEHILDFATGNLSKETKQTELWMHQ